ncbi:hypothetical protein HB847_02965 [Listeria booriae]|uniref:Crp/Fnr family transcriptional regulator n=1 Tax=Listeria booriae TaxID=1552123 RepID=A0A841Y4S9_9LIST|nr:hypothetical protein [Listeria booriae]MBC1371317.1 hypothetical protein [Listeria booriae]MBC2675949.1 hypothetical protein [Listeria booriae]
MDFLTIHNLLLRDPNLLLPLLDLSNMGEKHFDFYHVKSLDNNQSLVLPNEGKIIHVITGMLLQQISSKIEDKTYVNAIWQEDDFIFHNVFQQGNYEYIGLGDVDIAVYDANLVLQEVSKQPFFTDLIIDILKRQEQQFYLYSSMLTKSSEDRIIDILQRVSYKGHKGYHIPKIVNYRLLAKCCQVTPRTAKMKLEKLEKSNKIINFKENRILLY